MTVALWAMKQSPRHSTRCSPIEYFIAVPGSLYEVAHYSDGPFGTVSRARIYRRGERRDNVCRDLYGGSVMSAVTALAKGTSISNVGADADKLLNHVCRASPKRPCTARADFVDRVFALSDRPTPKAACNNCSATAGWRGPVTRYCP